MAVSSRPQSISSSSGSLYSYSINCSQRYEHGSSGASAPSRPPPSRQKRNYWRRYATSSNGGTNPRNNSQKVDREACFANEVVSPGGPIQSSGPGTSPVASSLFPPLHKSCASLRRARRLAAVPLAGGATLLRDADNLGPAVALHGQCEHGR